MVKIHKSLTDWPILDAWGTKEALGEGARAKATAAGIAATESGVYWPNERSDDRSTFAEEDDAAQGTAALWQVHHCPRISRPRQSHWWIFPGHWWHFIGDYSVTPLFLTHAILLVLFIFGRANPSVVWIIEKVYSSESGKSWSRFIAAPSAQITFSFKHPLKHEFLYFKHFKV